MKMNRSMVKRSFFQILVLSGVVALGGVMAMGQNPAAQTPDLAANQAQGAQTDQRTDGQIEMDVVHALDATETLKNDLITAATIQSEVTLAGTVSSDDSKKLAEQIVAKVAGVTKVHNNLKVGNPQQAQNEMTPQPEDQSDPGQGQQQSREKGE